MRRFSRANGLRETIRNRYGRIAASEGGGCGCGPASSCCGAPAPQTQARGLGYSRRELRGLPPGSNLGLSCGNPTALASLRRGETVLDLGCGAGFDVFLAARRVGPRGRVIGVDMTPAMIDRARRNAAPFRRKTGLDNVEFRLGEIEHLPVADSSVDVVISNCVINLSPDKPRVWREIVRVLKPGGRAAISDMALLKPLPSALRGSVEALVGCIAGAVLVEDLRRMVSAAGLTSLRIQPQPGAVEVLLDPRSRLYRVVQAGLPPGASLGNYVTSLSIRARKPGRPRDHTRKMKTSEK